MMGKKWIFFIFFWLIEVSSVYAQYPSCTHPVITSCPCVMDIPYTAYYLESDLYTNGDCIVIKAYNSNLVCQGHSIVGSGVGNGVNATNYTSEIVDCEIKNFYRGIIIKGNSNLVTRCKVSNNYFGVIVFDGDGNKVKRNIIVNNYWGLIVTRADYTYVYDNYISNNTENVFDEQSIGDDYFNTSKSPEENIISGSYVGGNYWDDYTGSDNDEDGLGESYYLIPCNSVDPNYCNKDYLPLVDINGPRYYDIQGLTGSVLYSPSAIYKFNITWKDNVQVDEVIFELDGVNYTLEKTNEYLGFDPNYRVEHRANYSISFQGLEPGTHYYRWYANDTRNNWNSTELFSFTIIEDTTPPTITILSPLDGWVYYSKWIKLKVNLDEDTSWIGYSLDGQVNKTLWINKPAGTYYKYVYVPSYGSHSIVVYANDTAGNMGESSEVHFTTKSWGGGCPYVFPWNGEEYVKDNNLLPKSEKVKGDVEDYYLLHKPLKEKDGKYSLLLKEFENEHDFFDQVKLFAVDHDPSFKIAIDPFGNILTYKNPVPPISAYDNKGKDVLGLINYADGDKYYESKKGDYLILNFGKVDSKNAKLVMRADPWRCCYKIPYSIHVQLANGEWKEIATVIPRNHWAYEIVDLSSYLKHGEELKVKLYFTANHRLDFVGLDTSEQEEFEVKEARLITAVHSSGKNVKSALLKEDKVYAEIVPGEEIKLEFSVPEKEGRMRDFLLYSKGYYHKINPFSEISKLIREFFVSILQK